MKKLIVLACAMAAWTVGAQTSGADRLIESAAAQHGQRAAGLTRAVKPNEIVSGKVAYGGIAVQLVKAPNPLQLFDPLAPPQYGSAQDNLVRDPTTGHAFGLRIFSIRF